MWGSLLTIMTYITGSALSPSTRITETGETRITEDSNVRVIE